MSMDRRDTAQWALAVGALGVVFGDIGTSPLYTEQTVFNPQLASLVVPITAAIIVILLSFSDWAAARWDACSGRSCASGSPRSA